MKGWPQARAHLQIDVETKLDETFEGVWELFSFVWLVYPSDEGSFLHRMAVRGAELLQVVWTASV